MQRPVELRPLDLSRRVSVGWLCALNLVGILIAGLWPFSPLPQNRVEWLHDENGIRFHGRGLVYGVENASGATPHSYGRNGFTVELLLQPDLEPSRNVPVFFTMYDPHSLEAITLGQWRSGLIVRWRNLYTP